MTLTLLREFWPFFLLGKAGQERAEGTSTLDLLCPATPALLREVYSPVLHDTNPTAAASLDATPDEELAIWVKVLRSERLGASEFTPAFLFHDGQALRGLAEVVKLPLFERQDVFLVAMHQRGLS